MTFLYQLCRKQSSAIIIISNHHQSSTLTLEYYLNRCLISSSTLSLGKSMWVVARVLAYVTGSTNPSMRVTVFYTFINSDKILIA